MLNQKLIPFVFVLLALASCSTKKIAGSKAIPAWVNQRPTNNMYYIGIGYANKQSSANDYLQVAKKNALQDLLGEMKVNVSSNSLLSQYQNNQAFSQQFFSDIKLIAEGTLEDFEIVDSYQNANDYWIYYRLNKADYELAQRKKIEAAINKAKDYLHAADNLNLTDNFTQIFKLRVKALAALQNYAYNNLETNYNGRNVYLLNDIVAQMQKQLYNVKLFSLTEKVNAIVGRPIDNPVTIKANISGSNNTISYLPMVWQNNQGTLIGTKNTETNDLGIATFYINRVLGNQPIQMVNFKVDVAGLFKADSFNFSMQRLIETFDAPLTKVQFLVEPIKVYFESKELNLGKPLDFNQIEPALKKKLGDLGCTFVTNQQLAQYTITINSNTKDEGIIWGKMLQSKIDVRIALTDNKTNEEVLKDVVDDVKGFQLTPENAGLDAYKNAVTEINNNIFPKIKSQLIAE